MRGSLINRLKHPVTRLVRDDRGTTAIEFGILGPLFFGMIFSAIEMGFILTKVALLETAVGEVARTVYIGHVSSGTATSDDLKKQICETVGLIDYKCRDNLSVELTPIVNYQSIPTTAAPCEDSDEPIKPLVNFVPGAGNSIVYMRVCLTTNIFTPGAGLGLHMTKTKSGKKQLISAMAFTNEPF